MFVKLVVYLEKVYQKSQNVFCEETECFRGVFAVQLHDSAELQCEGKISYVPANHCVRGESIHKSLRVNIKCIFFVEIGFGAYLNCFVKIGIKVSDIIKPLNNIWYLYFDSF